MEKLNRKPRNAAMSILAVWLVSTIMLVCSGAVSTPLGVRGPTSSTDEAILRWDGTGGTNAQNSSWTINDSNLMTAAGNIALGSYYLSGDGGSEGVSVAANGNVTTSSYLTTGNSIYISPNQGVTNNSGYLLIYPTTHLYLRPAASNHTYISDNAGSHTLIGTNAVTPGSVGIGSVFSSIPPNKLSVLGDIASYEGFASGTDYSRIRTYWNGTTATITTENTGATYPTARNIAITPAGGKIVHNGTVNLATVGTQLTIATGVITVTKSYHRVDTQGDAGTDDLDTISGGTEGDTLILRADDSTHDVVVKDGTGNIQCNGDFTLNNTQDTITLIFDGTNWLEVSRSDNGA